MDLSYLAQKQIIEYKGRCIILMLSIFTMEESLIVMLKMIHWNTNTENKNNRTHIDYKGSNYR